jgi:hypothetical protein
VAASVAVLSLASEFNWNAKGLECSNVDWTQMHLHSIICTEHE